MMTSSERQKKHVLIAGIIAVILFMVYAALQSISFETQWRYEKYNNGYRLISYTQAINDDTTEIVIPSEYEGKSVVAIDDKAFYKNNKIELVVIPDTVTEIGASVFKKCKNLKKIEFGKNITSIGGECFKDCESLEEAELPAGSSELRGEAFMGCSALRSIVLPLSITEIRGNTFEECTSLEVVEIPAGVTRIAAHAFYGCSSLRDVFVPDTVKEIGSSAFRRCPELKEIELPDGVSVNERAFKESPTRILEKKISDAMFEDIINEVKSRTDPESVYVLYEKSKGFEEAYIENSSVFIADDIRFNDVMDEQYALKEFKDAEALQKYLEQAKAKGASNTVLYFYSQIASEHLGYTYFVSGHEPIDDTIESQRKTATPADNSFIVKSDVYDSVEGGTIDFETADVTLDTVGE